MNERHRQQIIDELDLALDTWMHGWLLRHPDRAHPHAVTHSHRSQVTSHRPHPRLHLAAAAQQLLSLRSPVGCQGEAVVEEGDVLTEKRAAKQYNRAEHIQNRLYDQAVRC